MYVGTRPAMITVKYVRADLRASVSISMCSRGPGAEERYCYFTERTRHVRAH